MSIYAPEIVAFDLDPPLQYVGAEAKRERWLNVFATYQRLLGYEVRDLTITLGNDLAFGHSLNRVSGILKNGNRTGFWLSVDDVLSENRRQLDHRARAALRAHRSAEWQSGAES